MSDKNSEDLLINTLPDKVNEFRNKITNYKPPKKDKYGDGFLTQVYFAAKNSISGSMSSIRKELKLDNLTFQYYMDNNPDFVAAIQIGIYDNRKEKLAELESSLFNKAIGMEIEETKIEDSEVPDEDGKFATVSRKKTTIKKQIPPDTQAILTILQKIDPSYNPKQVLDINVNGNLNVEEDVTINVDYRMLSTDTIRELLNSNKQNVNTEINKTPQGESVRYLNTNKEAQKNRRKMSEDTKRKISEALKNRKKST